MPQADVAGDSGGRDGSNPQSQQQPQASAGAALCAQALLKSDAAPVAELLCQRFILWAQTPGMRRAAAVSTMYVRWIDGSWSTVLRARAHALANPPLIHALNIPPQKKPACRRQWYLRSLACGGDASMGALDVCMRALNVSQTELEGPAGVALDTPLPHRYTLACARDDR